MSWKTREIHLHSFMQEFPRRIRKDAEDLARVFVWRKSTKLQLADNYLMKLWECSRATVQRRLEVLENLGLIKRLTHPPKKDENGNWKQLRVLLLLVSQKKAQLKGVLKNSIQKSKPPMAKKPKLSFADWLSLRDDVPKGAFMYWMRQYGARRNTMGHLVNIWKKVRRRADVLESILWDADGAGIKGTKKVGFIVSEIHARI